MFMPLKYQPGVFKRNSQYDHANRWIDSDKVRFRHQMPEKIGGWEQAEFASGDSWGEMCRGSFGFRCFTQKKRWFVAGGPNKLLAYNPDSPDVVNITPVGYTTGREDAWYSFGYGYGLYGKQLYGRPRTTSTTVMDPTVWALDNWGDYLLACANTDGKIYQWDGDPVTVATVLTNAPINCVGVIVSNERHAVALGADGDPRRVEWSDRENNNLWAPSSTNKAGGFNLQAVGKIRAGRRTPNQILIWTEHELFSMNYVGGVYFYGFDLLGSDCGAAGPAAMCVVGDNAFWMSNKKFFIFDGSVRELDCDIYEHVFHDVNFQQLPKAFAWHNSAFHEVWFHYPSAASNEIDRYAIYNYEENAWAPGTLDRTTMYASDIMENPGGVSSAGQLYRHETGVDADGAALEAYIQGGPAEIEIGDRTARISAIVPDFREDFAGSVDISFKGKAFPADSGIDFGPYNVVSATQRIPTRIWGRQIAARIASSAIGDKWHAGRIRLDVMPGGRR